MAAMGAAAPGIEALLLGKFGRMVAVSYATSPPVYDKISGLTYATVTEEDKLVSRSSWNWRDVVGSVLVLLMILIAYLYFTG